MTSKLYSAVWILVVITLVCTAAPSRAQITMGNVQFPPNAAGADFMTASGSWVRGTASGIESGDFGGDAWRINIRVSNNDPTLNTLAWKTQHLKAPHPGEISPNPAAANFQAIGTFPTQGAGVRVIPHGQHIDVYRLIVNAPNRGSSRLLASAGHFGDPAAKFSWSFDPKGRAGRLDVIGSYAPGTAPPGAPGMRPGERLGKKLDGTKPDSDTFPMCVREARQTTGYATRWATLSSRTPPWLSLRVRPAISARRIWRC